jgi:acetyl esterase/lipase
VADDELLYDDASRLHDQVRSAGGVSELVVETGVFHVWQMLDGVIPEARQALRRAGQFVQDVAGGTG